MSNRHADFAEQFAPIDRAAFSGITGEQNTGYVSVAGYQRITVLVHALVVATTLDVDVEIATAVGGTNAFTLKSMAQLVAADDDTLVCIDIRADEMTNPSGASANEYSFLNVEVTPSGAATVSVLVLGWSATNMPVPVTLWKQAVS